MHASLTSTTPCSRTTLNCLLVGELGLEPRRALRPAASKAAVFTNFTILPGTRSFNRRTIDNLVLGGELPRHRCTATCLPNRYRDGVYNMCILDPQHLGTVLSYNYDILPTYKELPSGFEPCLHALGNHFPMSTALYHLTIDNIG